MKSRIHEFRIAGKMRFLFFAGILSILMVSMGASGERSIKSIVKQNKASLDPYQYDAYAVKDISYGSKEQSIVIQFAVYSDEEYKIIFCKTELPQEIDINVYDRNPKNKNRKLIYFDESGKKDQYACTFKPAASGEYYIEYKVPAATAPDQKGSMIVLIGIKDPDADLGVK